ncbi:hypothetical protein SteCoe_22040 [Stentor coeruleus]|uniref:Uncharacterized protein n=1 Tax=Stentor coeruleus TaxID=5963 RepID=A0A1R2BNA0_9CILI|nr:hypothetical protein SteCoe_22040 [Stentor coeruleus]
MSSKHRRMPSALPLISRTVSEELPTISLASITGFDPSLTQILNQQDKNNLKPISKTIPNSVKNQGQKFSHNYNISSNNDQYNFLSNSTENPIKETTQLNKHNENHENLYKKDKIQEPPISELDKGMNLIIKSREIFQNKLELLRKDIKHQLLYVFSQTEQIIQKNSPSKNLMYIKIEASNIDTERRIDSIRCSGDTIEGPGSTYYIDDLSLVKFDISAENYEKKPKKVKFKGLN